MPHLERLSFRPRARRRPRPRIAESFAEYFRGAGFAFSLLEDDYKSNVPQSAIRIPHFLNLYHNYDPAPARSRGFLEGLL